MKKIKMSIQIPAALIFLIIISATRLSNDVLGQTQQIITVVVDASTTAGGNISKLKKGYHTDTTTPLNYMYDYGFYSQKLGYENSLIRIHLGGPLSQAKKQAIRDTIEGHLQFGKPDFMVTIYGMPLELSVSQDMTPGRDGCDSRCVTYPPKDYNAWKNYVKEWVATLKPYNIKYWEIWNEPTDVQRPGCFWSGTEAQYLQLYKSTVEAIREAYGGVIPADIKIGGPALAGLDYLYIYGSSRPLHVTLPEFARKNNLPLDFFSLHYVDLFRLNYAIAIIRAELEKNNFYNREFIVDEYGLGDAKNKMMSSVETAQSFIRLAKLGFARQATFKLLDQPSLSGTSLERFGWSGLFGIVQDAEYFITPKFNLFDVINRMGNNMISVSAPTLIDGTNGQFAWQDLILATRSFDRVSVMLISGPAQQSFDLKINGLSGGAFISRTKYIIDPTHSNAYMAEDRIKAQVASIMQTAATITDPQLRGAYIIQEIDKINNWPEVKLYSETKSISAVEGTYQELLTLAPYAIQVIVLTDESACSTCKAAPYIAQATTKAQELGVPLSGSNFLGCDERNMNNYQLQDKIPSDLTGYDGIIFYNVVGTNAVNTINLPSKRGFMIYAGPGPIGNGGSYFTLNFKNTNPLVGIYTTLSNSVITVTGAPQVTKYKFDIDGCSAYWRINYGGSYCSGSGTIGTE